MLAINEEHGTKCTHEVYFSNYTAKRNHKDANNKYSLIMSLL